MAEKARYATAHWLRFAEITLPEQLQLSGKPIGAISWKIGSTGPVGPDGYRLPGNVWCAVGLFQEHAAAQAALENSSEFMPFVSSVEESWHVLLLPIRHSGVCNHLDREQPGEIFDVCGSDPGGTLFVITTAGYLFGPALDMQRVINFRRNVDKVHEDFAHMDGCLASQPFTPHTRGDDGCTLSAWRTDEAMLNAAYRAGVHRTHMDGHKASSAFDRSSFTRLRVLDAHGRWNGADPLA